MKHEKYLPIGTVVMLNGGKKRIMISGFCCSDESSDESSDENNSEKVYDYCGFLYPEGYMVKNQFFLFNHDQINQIYYLGLNDNENKEFQIKLKELVNNDFKI